MASSIQATCRHIRPLFVTIQEEEGVYRNDRNLETLSYTLQLSIYLPTLLLRNHARTQSIISQLHLNTINRINVHFSNMNINYEVADSIARRYLKTFHRTHKISPHPSFVFSFIYLYIYLVCLRIYLSNGTI